MRALAFVAAWVVPIIVFADTNLTSSVLDGSGGTSAGVTCELVSAAGQPGGIHGSSSGDTALYAGFLNTFSLQPDLDSDSDGLANEVDKDNDNDQLADEDEITRSAFNGLAASDPNKADTDGDGLSDGEESAAGSDPTDDTMYLHFTDARHDTLNDETHLEWQAHGGHTYKVYGLNELADGFGAGAHLGDVTVSGGTGPWRVTQTNFTDTSVWGAGHRFYYLRLGP